jgi:hypothetical protein
MYERFISSSMLTGILEAAMSVISVTWDPFLVFGFAFYVGVLGSSLCAVKKRKTYTENPKPKTDREALRYQDS